MTRSPIDFVGHPARPEPEKLVLLGTVTRPQGHHGAVRLLPQFDNPADFLELKSTRVFLCPPQAPGIGLAHFRETTVLHAAPHQQFVILELDGVPDMNAAEHLRNCTLHTLEDDLWDLPEGRYYAFQLVGCMVQDSASGAGLGRITRVVEGTGHDFLEIESPAGKRYLVPNVPEVIRSVDIQARQIRADIPPGLDEL